MFIGFLWYGVFFNEQWMAANGFTLQGEKMFKNGQEIPMNPTPMVVNVIAMAVYALVLNWLFGKMNVSTWQTGAVIGASIGLLMFLGVLTGHMFAMRPSILITVDGSYAFVLFTVIGAIVGGWTKK